MILCLETATSVCSVALCNSSGVIGLKESHEDRSHASLLTVFIEDLLREAGIKASDLEAVAVSKGPGSFTGLRIGVSAAKGISYATSIPLIGIETTLSMYHGIRQLQGISETADSETVFCPMIDARRMEVYYSLFDSQGKKIKDLAADIIGEDSFSNFPPSVKMIFFGDGALKYRNVLKRPNNYFADKYRISAGDMQKPACEALAEGRFEDVAYFEPLYLKDFITTKQVKNIPGNFLAR